LNSSKIMYQVRKIVERVSLLRLK